MSYISIPSFVSQKILKKNLVAIHEIKPVLTFERKYDANFLFTVTDSLIY